MIYEFLTPVAADFFTTLPEKEMQLGRIVQFYQGEKIDFQNFDIAIVGVDEVRGAAVNQGSTNAAAAFRKEFYRLFAPTLDFPVKVIDLGTIKQGANLRDTYFALSSVLLYLLTHKVIPIIVGGSHDSTYGQYLAYQELYAPVNVVVVDEKIDLESKDNVPAQQNFLMSILTHSPNYLYNYAHIGFQSFFTDKNAVDMLESLNFDCIRLGIARQKIEDLEPFFRDADMVSFDMSAVRMADAPAHECASPNGFLGEELCQMARYAGMSDRVTSIGFYEMNPVFDHRQQTAQLLAQAIWYFIEGFYSRRNDIPAQTDDFLKFIVKLNEAEHDIVFWKSKITNRWWVELPFADNKEATKNKLIACTYQDYEQACNDELPDRWMRAYNKLTN